MNIIRMYKVLFYTTDESLLRICLERKKQPHGYHSKIVFLLQNRTTFSVGSTEITVKVYQKMPGPPNDVTRKGFFFKFKP